MRPIRSVGGLIAGVLIALTGAVHSLVGWKEVRRSFEKAGVPASLLDGLVVPWHLAGLGMVVCGIILIWFFSSVLRQRAVSAAPALLVSGAYALFGIWGLVAVRPDPFFAAFVVPGALAFFAAWPLRGAER